jgi:hypothetical protein
MAFTSPAGRDSGAAAIPSPSRGTEAPPPAPSARLVQAHVALVTGRADEARSLLEQAETQLVFQPPTSSDPAARPERGIAAGQVSQALRLLDEGQTFGALRLVDLAIAYAGASARQAQAPTASYRFPGPDSWSSRPGG